MATKRVCDRCGAEINPYNSVTYAGMRRIKNDINDNDYELCVSCAHKLRKWFNGEENDNGKWIIHDDEFGLTCECSSCHIETIGDWKYCPNCGAKMDGGADDASV